MLTSILNFYFEQTFTIAPSLAGWLAAGGVFYIMAATMLLALKFRLLTEERYLGFAGVYFMTMAIGLLTTAFVEKVQDDHTLILVAVTSMNFMLIQAAYWQLYSPNQKWRKVLIGANLLGLVIAAFLPVHFQKALIFALYACYLGFLIWITSNNFENVHPWRALKLSGTFLAIALTMLACLLLIMNPFLSQIALGIEGSQIAAALWDGSFKAHHIFQAKMDGAVLILLTLPNIWFFIVTLESIIRTMMAFSPQNYSLEAVNLGSREYLDTKGAGGILGGLGLMANADHAGLVLRGHPVLEETMYRWDWFAKSAWAFIDEGELRDAIQDDGAYKYPYKRDIADDSELTREVFKMGGTQIYSPDKEGPGKTIIQLKGVKSVIAVPIHYNGAVIGVLSFESRKRNAFPRAVISRMEQMANYLAPLFASRRMLVAQHLLVRELEQSKALDTQEESHHKETKIDRIAHRAITKIHAFSGAQKTLVIWDIGFRRFSALATSDGAGHTRIQLDPLKGRGVKSRKTLIKSHARETLHYYTNPLQHPSQHRDEETGTFSKTRLGHIVFFVEKNSDPKSKPSLIRDELSMHAMSSRLVQYILDSLYLQQSLAVASLHGDLPEIKNHQDWFEAINNLCLKQGALWTITQLPLGSTLSLLGSLTKGEKRDFKKLQEHEISAEPESVELIHLKEPFKKASLIICLPLPNSKAILYLGLDILDFNREVELYYSPWQLFLEQLREIADHGLILLQRWALEGMTTSLEREAQMAIVQSLWIHEQRNLAAQIQAITDTIEDKIKIFCFEDKDESSQLDRALEKLGDLRRVVKTFNRIALQIGQPFGMDSNKPYTDFEDVLKRINEHYADLFKRRNMNFTHNIEGSYQTTVPLTVVYLVLANLIANSLQAIRGEGALSLNLEERDDHLLCHFEDNGPGIPEDKRPHIFNPGFSSKPKGGFGLPGSRSALARHSAEIWHDSSYKNGARFTVRLPRYMEAT